MRMSSIMRWRSGLAFAGKGVMIRLLLKNDADCLIRIKSRDGSLPDLQRRAVTPTARAVSSFGQFETFGVGLTIVNNGISDETSDHA